MKTTYQCELCGKYFTSKEKCKEHESCHITADKFTISKVQYFNGVGQVFPQCIELIYTDSRGHTYTQAYGKRERSLR